MFKLTAEKKEQLIRSVRARTILHDPRHPFHGEHAVRAYEWQRVADEVGLSVALVRNRWRNLRDCYQKWRRERQRDGVVKRYKRWPLAKLMSFMDECLPVPPAGGPSQPDEAQRDTPSPRTERPDSNDDAPAPQPKPPRKQRPDPPSVHVQRPPSTHPPGPSPDGEAHLMLAYAATLRRLAPRRAAHVRLQLARLFAAAELAELNEHDPQRSPQTPGSQPILDPLMVTKLELELDAQDDADML